MAKFVALFEKRGFSLARMISPPTRETPEAIIFTAPYCELDPDAQRFIEEAYRLRWVLPGFDWSAWSKTAEAHALQNPGETLTLASPQQLEKLVTMLMRQEHWSEGSLLEAFNAGLLIAIVKRMATLINEIR